MPKDSLAKDDQNNKERLQNKVCERYQSLYKKEKKKSNNMVVNDAKIYQKRKNKSLLSIKKLL